jgi:hypothetical protein
MSPKLPSITCKQLIKLLKRKVLISAGKAAAMQFIKMQRAEEQQFPFIPIK